MRSTRRLSVLSPALAAIFYPFLLQAFHAAVSSAGGIQTALAAILLALAFAMPLSGFVWVWRRPAPVTAFDLAARRLALISIGMPPLFVFTGVALGLVHAPLSDLTVWIIAWALAALLVWLMPDRAITARTEKGIARWRVAHGIAAAVILLFVLFHLTNHLFGLEGPKAHAAIMAMGRKVYRAPLIEPVFVALLLFQVTSGFRLAWRWSALKTDIYRVFQLGSGVYLSAFIIAHLNSALVSARAVHKIDTNFAWAAGLPTGLIQDAWNIRLLPHYALGVFFVLGHLVSGARVVLIAHGGNAALANRLWFTGLAAAALIATAIICGLCGVRL